MSRPLEADSCLGLMKTGGQGRKWGPPRTRRVSVLLVLKLQSINKKRRLKKHYTPAHGMNFHGPVKVRLLVLSPVNSRMLPFLQNLIENAPHKPLFLFLVQNPETQRAFQNLYKGQKR